MTLRYRTVDSPLGPLTLAGSDTGLMHLRMVGQTREPDATGWRRDDGAFADAADQLQAYFAGELTAFDVALEMTGTDFQRRVWAALQTIPYGQTRSYGQIAEQIGAAGSSRAVGMANARNPVAIVVPCHRVIGAAGAITGYAGGVERKRALLELEMQNAGAVLL